jgi:hypothetical protein
VSDEMNTMETIELLLLNHQHIHENIKFADQKAGAVAAADGALLALTYNLIDPWKMPNAVIAGLLVCLILSIAIGYSFWVVRPRGGQNRRRGPGVVDSIRISLYSHDQFQTKSDEMKGPELLYELRSFIYDRSYIDDRKYFYLRVSLTMSAIGWASALIFAVVVKVHA